MSVRVPMTLAITRVLLVRAGGETFGLPLGAVMQIVRPHPTAIGRVGNERVLVLDGKTYPLRDLADTLGLPRAYEAWVRDRATPRRGSPPRPVRRAEPELPAFESHGDQGVLLGLLANDLAAARGWRR